MAAIPCTETQGRPEALPRLLGLCYRFIVLGARELDLVVVGTGQAHDGAEIDEGGGGGGGLGDVGGEKEEGRRMTKPE